MTQRFALYFAPARDSVFDRAAEAWLAQSDLLPMTVSARRYGFHATLKAPFSLAPDFDRADLEQALSAFAARHAPVSLGRLAPTLLDGFLALTATPQPQALTDFAATVVTAFERLRAPLDSAERDRRLKAQLSPRQIELVDLYGYPYVLEQFLFHMTLTDRLPGDRRDELLGRAVDWFAGALGSPIVLDRLALFHEAEPGAAFTRLDDFVLQGSA